MRRSRKSAASRTACPAARYTTRLKCAARVCRRSCCSCRACTASRTTRSRTRPRNIWRCPFVSSIVWPARPSTGLQRLERGFDLAALRFEERRQREGFAEVLDRFIGREAGAVRRQLEEDAAGLAEVEAAEIEPIDRAARSHAQLGQVFEPAVVILKSWHAKRHVVHAAGAQVRSALARF